MPDAVVAYLISMAVRNIRDLIVLGSGHVKALKMPIITPPATKIGFLLEDVLVQLTEVVSVLSSERACLFHNTLSYSDAPLLIKIPHAT